MAKPKLTYFDAPVSRGEECRLALHLAGIDFDDNRVKPAEWPTIKPTTPYGSVPVLEIDGQPPLAHSNAILVLIGRRHGLHPKDDLLAARHEGMMQYVEELRAVVGPTLRISDPAEKQKVREAMAAEYLPQWGATVEKNLGDGPFFAGTALHVVDLKLHMAYRWFAGGRVDHVPATIFAGFPKFTRVHDAVRDHEGVRGWYARS
jgi:prostaglandin-H2 D-isomerase / glutathione transferase